MKILEIIDAWIRAYNPNSEDIIKAEYRAKICDKCHYKQALNSALLKKLSEKDKLLNKFKCGKCGCMLSKKIFSYFKEGCEAGKWEM